MSARLADMVNPQITYVTDTIRLETTGAQVALTFTVNADDITDKLTIQIVSINDVDLAKNPNFVRVMVR